MARSPRAQSILFKGLWRPTHLSRCTQKPRHLSLAYTLHEPSKRRAGPYLDPSIIILHGLFGSKQNNRSISKALARDLDRQVYAIDLRNHGHSPHDPVHDYDSMASDIEEFISQHRLERPVLIGHSMGAKVVMTVALRDPALVSSIIPVDNAPVDAVLESNFAKYVQGMKKIEEARVSKQPEADSILKLYEEALPIRQFLLTNLIRDPVSKALKFRVPIQTLCRALGNMGDFPFKNPDLARYDGPVLFVRGSESPYIPDEALPLIGRFFPTFEIRDIKSGHWVISEQPEAFRSAVVEFLSSKD